MSVCLYFQDSSSEFKIQLVFIPQSPTTTPASFHLSSLSNGCTTQERYLLRLAATFSHFWHLIHAHRGSYIHWRVSIADSQDRGSPCAESLYMNIMWVLSLYFECIFSINMHIFLSWAVYCNILDWAFVSQPSICCFMFFHNTNHLFRWMLHIILHWTCNATGGEVAETQG